MFRAFSTAAVALSNKVRQIRAAVEQALALRAAGAAQICTGEVGGRKPAKFHFDVQWRDPM